MSQYTVEGTERVKIDLARCDGNAYSLMGAFSSAAKRQGWTRTQIELVMVRCTSGDYDHLLQVLIANTDIPDNVGEDGTIYSCRDDAGEPE